MKSFKRPEIVVLLLFLFIPSSLWAQKNIKGSGYVLTQQRTLEDFNRIEVSSGIDLAIVQGDLQPVTVEADDNLFPYIKTVVRNKILKIYIPDTVHITKYADMNVLISMPALCSLMATKGSRIDASPQLWEVKNIQAEVATGGHIRLHIKASSTDVTATTSGRIELKGVTKNLTAVLKTAARMNARNLLTDKASITGATGAKADIQVKDSLQYNLIGHARLILHGNPTITNSYLHSGSKLIHER